MSLGPLGAVPASAAGSPLAQSKGARIERAAQDEADQHRRIEADRKAENASGIGEADGEDHETAERDAHGRRLWGESPQRQGAEEEGRASKDRPGKDASGQSGNLLDLSG